MATTRGSPACSFIVLKAQVVLPDINTSPSKYDRTLIVIGGVVLRVAPDVTTNLASGTGVKSIVAALLAPSDITTDPIVPFVR